MNRPPTIANSPLTIPAIPNTVIASGPQAQFAFDEYFSLANDHTKSAYHNAVCRFLDWCDDRGLALTQILPSHVSEYEKRLTHLWSGRPASKATRKLHLSAIRGFLNALVMRHAIALNPANSVRGAKVSGNHGKTPPLPESMIPRLLESCDPETLVGRRNRVILGILMYTAARRGALAKLRLRDYWSDGLQHFLRFDEKNGKQRDIPVRHDLQGWIDDYIAAAGINQESKDAPLIRSAIGRTGNLSENGLTPAGISKLVKRCFRQVGLPETLVAHSFRATTITNLLSQGVSIESVAELAGHADCRTTQGYNHSRRQIQRNLVERIAFAVT